MCFKQNYSNLLNRRADQSLGRDSSAIDSVGLRLDVQGCSVVMLFLVMQLFLFAVFIFPSQLI